MQVHLACLDNDGDLRTLAVHGQGVEQGRVRIESGGTIHAQRLLHTGNEKEQTNLRILQDVQYGIRSAVAQAVRNSDMRLTQDAHETRRVAFGRYIALARATGRAYEEHRRELQKSAAVLIQLRLHLVVVAGVD